MQWYWANSAGTWYCHEQSGTICDDHTKAGYVAAGPGHPIAAPPSNPIHLEGNVTWSKLGRFRGGGAILLDGSTAFGWMNHTSEYNFTQNNVSDVHRSALSSVPSNNCSQYYGRAVSEFTVQLTIHPVGPTTGGVQMLVAKDDEWRLLINAEGRLEWHVHTLGGWLTTIGTRVFKPVSEASHAYVIKATHAGGRLKLFSCILGLDFRCELGPTPESSNFSATACTGGPLVGWMKTPSCLVTTTNNITVGAAVVGTATVGDEESSGAVASHFNGAMVCPPQMQQSSHFGADSLTCPVQYNHRKRSSSKGSRSKIFRRTSLPVPPAGATTSTFG